MMMMMTVSLIRSHGGKGDDDEFISPGPSVVLAFLFGLRWMTWMTSKSKS